jgi:hypothetical protein
VPLPFVSAAGRALPLVAAVACAAPSAGPVVVAPSGNARPPAPSAPPAGSEALTACALPWTLEDVAGGPGRVVVVCGSDVRRQAVESGPMTRAIDPALEPARQRVCSCAARLPLPAFVDLVVTSVPDEGHARVEASEPDEELDADVAAAFVACVGTLSTTFASSHADTCGAEKATYVYPLRVDLGH